MKELNYSQGQQFCCHILTVEIMIIFVFFQVRLSRLHKQLIVIFAFDFDFWHLDLKKLMNSMLLARFRGQSLVWAKYTQSHVGFTP